MPVDNRLPTGLTSYSARARAFRGKEAMALHQTNIKRSVCRGDEQWKRHDVERRWNENPALLKTRLGSRPTSAAGLTPQTHARTLVRADEKVLETVWTQCDTVCDWSPIIREQYMRKSILANMHVTFWCVYIHE